jgi:2'-5' RNA ligase
MGSDPTAALSRVPTGAGLAGSSADCPHSAVPPEERLNVFALVIYIPDPLGKFLDDLRRELAPAYNPHAHVSVMPPRPISVDWEAASQHARSLIEGAPRFSVELTDVGIFPVTNVIYLEIGQGAADLSRVHGAMNRDALAFDEPFAYHPHTTLAQELPLDSVAAVHEAARRRWQEYRGPRNFPADRAVFVQNTLNNCWIDLAEYHFGVTPIKI